jgi:hypothetical protein
MVSIFFQYHHLTREKGIQGILMHFCKMFIKLKNKWKVSWFQFTLIIVTFALGGSLCARVGSWLLGLVLSQKNVFYWICYVPLISLLWPICVLAIGIPLGQFDFFWKYVKKLVEKTGTRIK